MNLAADLRREAILRGSATAENAGWSLVLSRPGAIAPSLGWMLSGKRKNGGAPNAQNLAFLRRFAVECGAPDREPEQVVDEASPGGGTWCWRWEPTEEERASMLRDVADRILRENDPADLVEGTTWSQGMDPIDPRFAIVTMRFPTEGMPLASYRGSAASDRMRRFASGFLAGQAGGRSGRKN